MNWKYEKRDAYTNAAEDEARKHNATEVKDPGNCVPPPPRPALAAGADPVATKDYQQKMGTFVACLRASNKQEADRSNDIMAKQHGFAKKWRGKDFSKDARLWEQPIERCGGDNNVSKGERGSLTFHRSVAKGSGEMGCYCLMNEDEAKRRCVSLGQGFVDGRCKTDVAYAADMYGKGSGTDSDPFRNPVPSNATPHSYIDPKSKKVYYVGQQRFTGQSGKYNTYEGWVLVDQGCPGYDPSRVCYVWTGNVGNFK